MGVGLEFAQGRLAYRSYDMFDMYANALGVLLGWAAALVLSRIRAS
jgi:glycopeptide antibiotics resistance protein